MRSTQRAPLVAALCLASSSALAQQSSPPSADRSIEDEHRRGMALRARHEDEAARAVFEQLWERTREPRARARQALAEHSLGRYADAEAHLSEALAAREDPWVAQNRTLLDPVLQQARAAQGISILIVRSDTRESSVFIAGTLAGATGASLRVPPGRMTFEVRAPGFDSASRTIELSAGATTVEELSLSPRETPSTPAQSRPSSEPVVPRDALRQAPPRTEPAPVAASSNNGLRPVAWSFAVGGLGLAVTGVVAWAVGAGAASRFNSDACLSVSRTRAQNCPDDLASAETMQIVSLVGLIGAGALAATSTALFVLSRPRAESQQRASLRCLPSALLGSASLLCAGEF